MPTLVNIDKSGANKAGIEDFSAAGYDAAPVEVRQCKYLNNVVEQDQLRTIAERDGLNFAELLEKSLGAYEAGRKR